MKAWFPLYLGARNLLGRRGRASPHLTGSILGIGLSLVPLILVLIVADGMIEGITRRYLELGTYHAQVVLPPGFGEQEVPGLLGRLRSQPGVRLAIEERQGLGLLYTPVERTAVTLRAVPPELYAEDEGFRRYFRLESGSFQLGSRDSILLGREMAERLRVGVGDRVKLLVLRSIGQRRELPLVATFTVRGTFSTGYQELDKQWAYIPLAASGRLLAGRGTTRFLGLKLQDPFTGLEGQLQRLSRLLPAEAEIYSWYQLEKANYKSFQTTKMLLLFIMALIVVVAAVNISGALVMVVLEHLPEIAFLKAMGAGPGAISLSFLVTGLLTGLAGSVLGLAAGLAVALNVNALIRGLEAALNAGARLFRILAAPVARLPAPPPLRIFNAEFYLEQIPIHLHFGELYAVGAATLLLAVLAAYLPARKAGSTRPMDVLRRY
jgi:lipoprotein-releasing system permease protein